LHPNIQQHHETVNPAVHGSFSSEDLHKMWKGIHSDYDKVMINFAKSGNHNSNFTKAAIIALRDQHLLDTTEEDFDEILMRMMFLVWRKVTSVTLKIVF
jgi:hypothetical protein